MWIQFVNRSDSNLYWSGWAIWRGCVNENDLFLCWFSNFSKWISYSWFDRIKKCDNSNDDGDGDGDKSAEIIGDLYYNSRRKYKF